MAIELILDRSSPTFMQWFDAQIHRLVGWLGPGLPPGPSGTFTGGLTFPGREETTIFWSQDLGSYWNYLDRGPDYTLSDDDFSKQFPLQLLLSAHRAQKDQPLHHAQASTPDAAVITLEHLQPGPRIRISIDYQLPETDCLLWLLREIAGRYSEARNQLARGVLEELLSRASPQEQAEWQQPPGLEVPQTSAPQPTPTQPAEAKMPAADAPMADWEALINPPGRPGRRTPREDIWAAVEVLVRGRPQDRVYQEWQAKDEVKLRQLADPYDSFKKMLNRRRKKLGQNE